MENGSLDRELHDAIAAWRRGEQRRPTDRPAPVHRRALSLAWHLANWWLAYVAFDARQDDLALRAAESYERIQVSPGMCASLGPSAPPLQEGARPGEAWGQSRRGGDHRAPDAHHVEERRSRSPDARRDPGAMPEARVQGAKAIWSVWVLPKPAQPVNRDIGVAVALVMARLADRSPDQVASIRLTGGARGRRRRGWQRWSDGRQARCADRPPPGGRGSPGEARGRAGLAPSRNGRRALRDHPGTGPRRLRCGLRGQGPGPRPPGGGEGRPPRSHHRGGRQGLPRGRGHRPPRPPQPDHPLRGGAERARAVPGVRAASREDAGSRGSRKVRSRSRRRCTSRRRWPADSPTPTPRE